jgi:hypothetical protein
MMWHCVFWWISSIVSEESATSVFSVESWLVPPKHLYVSARLRGHITVFMYDLLNDAVSSSDGGPIALNDWMIVMNWRM